MRDDVFRDYLSAYRDVMRTTRYADMRARQGPPYVSLNEGGAGTAYALWRLGDRRRASAWLASAMRDRRPGSRDRSLPKSWQRESTLYGLAGVRWVRALASGGLGIDAYLQNLRRAGRTLEFASGSAGHLVAVVLLHREYPHRALGPVMDRIGRRLMRAAARRAARPWRASDAVGFAHGWPGILYAILAWHEVRGIIVSPWLCNTLRRLAAIWPPALPAAPRFGASWCNGTAGAALLWARAYGSIGDPMFLDRARRSARAALASSGHLSTLCCGDVGVAYAALTMARIDQSYGWRDRARTVAARTIRTAAMPSPFGLFQGHPGLVCLALDCLENRRGFPAIEG